MAPAAMGILFTLEELTFLSGQQPQFIQVGH